MAGTFLVRLLIVSADDATTVKDRLAGDPWFGRLSTITSIEPWSVWLRGPG